MKSRSIFLSIALGTLILFACNTNAPSVTRIIVEFPNGGLRVLVQRDDDIRLFYGELPTSQAVQNSAFDIDDLFQQLLPRLQDVLPAENRPVGQPYGMVTIEFTDGSGQDYLIYDETFAIELFKTACANRVEGQESGGEIITAECAKLEGVTP